MSVFGKAKRDENWVLKAAAAEEGHSVEVGGLYGRARLAESEASRHSLAKFVELSRRQLGQSLEEFAAAAQMGLGELLAIETGQGDIDHAETIERLAEFLKVDARPLLELAGLRPVEDEHLWEAALQFAARTELVRPLEPEEAAALLKFREEAWAGRTEA